MKVIYEITTDYQIYSQESNETYYHSSFEGAKKHFLELAKQDICHLLKSGIIDLEEALNDWHEAKENYIYEGIIGIEEIELLD